MAGMYVWIRRLILLVLLGSGISAAGYVRSDGFSRKWREFVIEQFKHRGVYLTLDRLTLDPFEGVVARGITVFQDADRKSVVAEVDRLHLDLDYGKMLRNELFLEGVDLREANLSFAVDPEETDSEVIKLEDISARLYMIGDRIEVRKAEAKLFGLALHLRGSVLKPKFTGQSEDPAAVEERKRRRMALLKARRGLILDTARVLKHFETAVAPNLDVEITGDLAKPEEMNATMHLRASDLRHGTYVCEDLDVLASYSGETVDLSHLRVRDRLGQLELAAAWTLGGQDVDFHFRSTADLPGLCAAVFEKEAFREVVFYEPVSVRAEGIYHLNQPTAEGGGLPVNCVGSVDAGRFATRGEMLEGLSGSFGLAPEGWYVRDVRLRHSTGSMSLQAMWREGEGFRYRALLQMDPHVFLPFTNRPQTQEIIKRFKFRHESSIFAEVEGAGPDPNIANCTNQGRAEVHNFAYRGQDFERLSADFEFTGPRATYSRVEIERKEGRASAKEVKVDDAAKTALLSGVLSDLDPVALTSCFNEQTAAVIKRYRFDKHPRVELDGLIGYKYGNSDFKVKFKSTGTAHYVLWDEDYTIHLPAGELKFKGRQLGYAVTGKVFGQDMACRGTADLTPDVHDYTVSFQSGSFPYGVFGKPLPFERVSAEVVCKKGVATFNAGARLFNGSFTLKGKINDAIRQPAYEGELRMNGLSFKRFARVYSPSNDTEGDLTGHFIFSGKLGDWRTLKGRGALIILNGNLYAVPILGPLTPLIGALLPRPMSGYNLAKEADCTFQVADGFVRTDDLEALTGVFRLVSKGQVDFLEDRIKFEAQVKFRGLPGLVLFPVSEIFEYVGEGSVGEPMWRPRYFSTTQEKEKFRKPGEAPAVEPAAGSVPRAIPVGPPTRNGRGAGSPARKNP